MKYEQTLAYAKAQGLIPKEKEEQMVVVDWLRIKRIRHFHVANERIASVAYKKELKALGVSAGVPDLVILLPTKILFIEMKRAKKQLSKVSVEQKEWIEALNLYVYIKAKVCYGSGEAIDFIQENL
ncbi:VRR-NUC domain-containing protein [Campylobacter fetus]|uniref:VRR-NUC domain-containing protein n=1 Tax=Campylobacter fetus TaxID=196 RepID=UPI000818973D|nr:VRR-NUC domain-containing protein [Campylobacter fetus]